MQLLAVDPGDKHVGMALFEAYTDETRRTEWFCRDAWETEPESGIDYIASALLNYQIDTLVVELFRLYPDKAMAQTGSTMPTCELIGQIKWAHRLDCRRRRDVLEKGPSVGKWSDKKIAKEAAVDLILQPASIQQPTAGLLRRRGVKSVAKHNAHLIRAAGGEGDHAVSAELHGWHAILRPGFR